MSDNLEAIIREAKAVALEEAAEALSPRGILWWGDYGVQVADKPYGLPRTDLNGWLRARAEELRQR